MTRDQLIEKRRKKKRFRRICAAASVAAVGMLVYGAAGIIRTRTHTNPGEYASNELTEVDGIVSVYEEPELNIEEEVETPELITDEVTEDVAVEEIPEVIEESIAESVAESIPPTDTWEYTSEGTFYRYADGSLATGFVNIDGALYCFGYDGVMLTGWQEDGDLLYYFSEEDGKAVTGEQQIDGKTYYFDEDGINDPSKTVDPEASAGMVALTYDDGPGYYTDALLDLLDSYGAKATFFMIGEEIENYPDQVLREHEMGMEQGNHSWDHKTLTHLSDGEIEEEFERTSDLLESITGERPDLFRAPGGGINDAVYDNSLGMKSILWSIDTLDWETKDAQQTYDTVINNVQDGDIILMHEIYEATLKASEELIPKLQEMGYKLVTVSELAAAKGVDLETWESYYAFY